MRRLVVSEFVTLDGVMEAPETWSFPFWNDEIARFKREELFASEALLLGRKTYETFAAAWPSRSGADGFAARMNQLPKHVASRSPLTLDWNGSQRLEGDLGEAVAALKAGDGGDILVGGSRSLVGQLLLRGLVDEVRLLVYPLTRGRGLRLLDEPLDGAWALTGSEVFSTGVVALVYRPPS